MNQIIIILSSMMKAIKDYGNNDPIDNPDNFMFILPEIYKKEFDNINKTKFMNIEIGFCKYIDINDMYIMRKINYKFDPIGHKNKDKPIFKIDFKTGV